MVECRAVFLAVGGIYRVGDREVCPTCIPLGFADVGACLGGDDVEHHIIPFVGREVERHGVVHLGLGHTDIYGAVQSAVDKHVDSSIVIGLLDGHHQVASIGVDADQGVVDSEVFDLHVAGRGCRCRHGQRKQGEHCCG